LLVLILLSAILPARLLRDRFVAQGSIIMFLTSFWAVALALHDFSVIRSEDPNKFLTPSEFLLWSVLYLASIGVYWALIRRSKRLEAAVNAVAERLTVLLYVYVSTSLFSVIVVILRNI
jgi:hypothetical protein